VRTRTRDEWAAVFADTDACVAPVLSLAEAARHPHNVARGSFITVDGVEQHAPAPRFSRSAARPVQGPHRAGEDTVEVLREAGFSGDDIERLRAAGGLS
jgi:alpha-methylacyl-CoA racemase